MGSEAVREFLEGNWTSTLEHTREVLNIVPGCTNSTLLLMQVLPLRSTATITHVKPADVTMT